MSKKPITKPTSKSQVSRLNCQLKVVGLRWDEKLDKFVEDPSVKVVTEGHHPPPIRITPFKGGCDYYDED